MTRRRLTAAALFAATLVGLTAPVAVAGGGETSPVQERVDRLVVRTACRAHGSNR